MYKKLLITNKKSIFALVVVILIRFVGLVIFSTIGKSIGFSFSSFSLSWIPARTFVFDSWRLFYCWPINLLLQLFKLVLSCGWALRSYLLELYHFWLSSLKPENYSSYKNCHVSPDNYYDLEYLLVTIVDCLLLWQWLG